MFNKGSCSSDAKWAKIGRRSVRYFNEYTEMRLSVISTPEARESWSKEYGASTFVSPLAHID